MIHLTCNYTTCAISPGILVMTVQWKLLAWATQSLSFYLIGGHGENLQEQVSLSQFLRYCHLQKLGMLTRTLKGFISLTLKQIWGEQSWEENQESARMCQLLSDRHLLAEKLDSRELRGYGNQWVQSIIQSTFSTITMCQALCLPWEFNSKGIRHSACSSQADSISGKREAYIHVYKKWLVPSWEKQREWWEPRETNWCT